MAKSFVIDSHFYRLTVSGVRGAVIVSRSPKSIWSLVRNWPEGKVEVWPMPPVVCPCIFIFLLGLTGSYV